MVSDYEGENKSITHERAEVIITLTKSRDKAKLESGSGLKPHDILTFLTKPGSFENMGVRALMDMRAMGMLMKKSLFDYLKKEIVKEPKAKTWAMGAGTFVAKKKALITACLLPSITTNCSFNMEINAMPEFDQPYALTLGRDLMCQLQLMPDIIKNMIQ